MIVLDARRATHPTTHDLLQIGMQYQVFAKIDIAEYGIVVPPWSVKFIPTDDKTAVLELLKLKNSNEPLAYERFSKGCKALVQRARELKPELFASFA